MKESASNLGRTREIELDFLRGLAILAVVDFHDSVQILLYPLQMLGFPRLGWMGVDIFFVLSGFLVGGLLIKEWRISGRVDSKRFLIRRGFKIWPQYYFFLLLVVLTGHHSLRVMWPSFLHLQNYFVVVPHLWTLAVEEHAYLLLVAMVVIASRYQMRKRTVLIVLAVLSACVIVLRAVLASRGLPYIMGTHTRIEAIFYGVMLALLFHCVPETFQRLQDRRWLWVGAILLALGFLRLNLQQGWALSATFDMANVIGISLLMLVYRHRPNLRRIWVYRVIAWIGLYSYGIYLWHVSAYAYVIRIGQHLPPRLTFAWGIIAEPLLGIAIGVTMTKLVEFPMLRLRDRWFPRRIASEPTQIATADDTRRVILSELRQVSAQAPR